MATFVLVSGAWMGGWCWQRVRPLLRAAGHEVYTPTLTGLGDRVHLGTPETGLETHIQDVLNLMHYEDLHDVILLGHSYAGLVSGSVGDRMPERIAQLLYLGAEIPHDGESMIGGWSDAGRAEVEADAQARGDGWRWPMPDDMGTMIAGMSEDDLRWFRANGVGHPLKAMTDPVRLTRSSRPAVPHTFINCTLEGWPPPDEVQAPGWQVRELPTGHWPMISHPRETADLLMAIAGEA